MNKDVLVKNKATIESIDGLEKIVTKSHGCYYEKEDTIYVLYDEETESGSINKCRIKLTNYELEMRKNGEVITVMSFNRNESTSSLFKTPYGIFNLEIETKKLDIFKTSSELKIKLEYKMRVGDIRDSYHKMDILVKEKD